MRVFKAFVLAIAVFVALAAAPALASPVEYSFSGTLTSNNVGTFFPDVADAPFTGTIVMEDSLPFNGLGQYQVTGPDYYLELVAAGHTARFTGTQNILINPANGEYDVTYLDPALTVDGSTTVPLYTGSGVGINLASSSGSFPTAAYLLPDGLMSQIPGLTLTLLYFDGSHFDLGLYNGPITEGLSPVTAAVPLPAPSTLLGSALAALALLGALARWGKGRRSMETALPQLA